MKYAELLNKPESTVKQEQIEFATESAKNTHQQGILSLQSDLLQKKSNVATKEAEVKTAKLALENAKSANPYSAQALVTAYTSVKQAEENLKAAQAEQTNVQELLTFMEQVQEELF